MTHASRVELRTQLLGSVPRWYSPATHLALPALACIGVAALALSRVSDLRAWQVALVPVFLLAGNAIEWHAHRGVLHRRTRFLAGFYLRHVPQHHALFVPEDLAIHSLKELRLVLLPGYALPAALVATVPAVAAFRAIRQPNLAALWVATAAVYLLAYEAAHLACHLPESSAIGRLPLVERLRARHRLHHVPHLSPWWNFNVTAPLWDHLKGTAYASPSPAPTPAPLAAPLAARRAR